MNKENRKFLIYLHILLVVYSLSAVCSKLASVEKFLSFRFCLFYGLVLFLLALYALCWQQIIKHLPLTFAYANKAITVVWAILWGMLIFGEKLTAGKVIGAVFVICGIVLYALNDVEDSGSVSTGVKPDRTDDEGGASDD
ncbi:MAG: DMT family transporter [Lachnospiraceae bacterium]|nr:DMT family transporter [Lachnospiraceae bacterium]